MITDTPQPPQVRKTALREARILKQLHHDGVVQLLESFREDDRLCLVFEYMERTILEELERYGGGGMPPELVRRVMWQLLQAVNFLHSLQVSEPWSEGAGTSCGYALHI